MDDASEIDKPDYWIFIFQVDTRSGKRKFPNGTYTYDFMAQPAGALAYHCHVPSVMQHVRMGLYGAFIVYPKTPLPPARGYVLVNGEYDTQNQLYPIPEYFMFSGHTEQYNLQQWATLM
jgi:nitrite reductase (NO-forming)